MNDFFAKFSNSKTDLGQYATFAQNYFFFPLLKGEIGPRMYFEGKEKIVWSINNYLGLANDPEVRKADTEATKKWGLAYPMGARMMTGNTELHLQLERKLADFVNKQEAILLNYGYQGIMSVIDTICSRHDIVVYDAECHACIVDGLRMSPCKRFVFKHNDVEDCEKQLKRAVTQLKGKSTGGILVISEGVFGMAGDQGKIKEIADLKKQYDFRLLVDDAHGFGTLGKTGAGVGEEQNCNEQIDLYFSTFAKSFASIGAFIAGDSEILSFIKFNIRSQIFAKSLPSPFVEGNLKRLEMIKTRPELKEKLWANTSRIQKGFRDLGFDLGNTSSPVTPIFFIGDYSAIEVCAMSLELREHFNIFCSVVVYPVIPKGQIIFRIIPTASHSFDDIDQTLDAFKQLKDKVFKREYKKYDGIANVEELKKEFANTYA